MNLTFDHVSVETGSPDAEGRLVLADGLLVAVLVRLSREHGSDEGMWYLEHGFGRLEGADNPVFATLDDARAWIDAALARRGPARPS